MLIVLDALSAHLPVAITLDQATTVLPMLGFPIDGVEAKEGTHVLDVDVTANRGDVMSHQGVARELAAKLKLAVTPALSEPLQESAPLREVRIESPLCARYATAVLTLKAGAGTPAEAVRFLGVLGAGAKQLAAVDASNELLHRYGHPTHAFDADKLHGALIVRMAKPGEQLVTLDGVTRKLTAEDLVIADEKGPVALAGVMGGESTKVTASTTRVLLESAYFDPKTVRLMARRHSLHTDASHRFGRGADPAMAQVARDLLVHRLQAWAGATLEGAWTVGALPSRPEPIALTSLLLNRCGGEIIPADEAKTLLERLGCKVAGSSEPGAWSLSVMPPSWRHDLSIAEDLAEEVLRLRGYDHLPMALPHVQADPEPLDAHLMQRQTLAKRLAQLGFHQTVTYGFIAPEEDAPFADSPTEDRTLGNPLGLEYSVMRSSLLPSLRSTAEANLRQGAKEVRLFEIAPSYRAGLKARMDLALVWAGRRGGEDPLTPARAIRSEDLRGVAADLGAGQIEVKALGEGLYGMEIPLERLPLPEERIIPAYKPFSRHPTVERDLSLLVDLTQVHADLVGAMAKVLPSELQSVGCVDVFRHKSLPAGKQAWLLRFRFQADRTLTGDEVDGWMKAALTAAEGCGAQLRA
jgi:phenylalanyl-tRNA synthetase beta chain